MGRGPQRGVDLKMTVESKAQSSLLSGLLVIASLSSLMVVVLYAIGFLVSRGQGYLLGFQQPPAIADHLLLAGNFLFHSLQCLIQVFFGPVAPVWPGKRSLSGYLGLIVILMIAILFLRSPDSWWRGKLSRFRVLKNNEIILSVMAVLIFGSLWLPVLTTPFAYHDLLFPLAPDTRHDRVREYAGDLAALATDELDAKQRRRQSRTLLKSMLRREMSEQLARGDTKLQKRLAGILMWELSDPRRRSMTFGLIVLISLLHVTLSASEAWRPHPPPDPRPPFGFLWRVLAQAILILMIAFQACTIPFIFGILMLNHDFPQVTVTVHEAEHLTGKEFLLMAQDEKNTYLYRHQDFWVIYSLPTEALKELRIQGSESALSWINDFLPEN